MQNRGVGSLLISLCASISESGWEEQVPLPQYISFEHIFKTEHCKTNLNYNEIYKYNRARWASDLKRNKIKLKQTMRTKEL